MCRTGRCRLRPESYGPDVAHRGNDAPFAVPDSFREMPRFWDGGDRQWLDGLPATVAGRLKLWHLELDGEVRHGSNAIAVPVCRGGDQLVLRVTAPQRWPGFDREAAALAFWAGRGTVRLLDADADDAAMLLERLAMDGTLADVPLDRAVPVIGHLMRRLAVESPGSSVPSTAGTVARRALELEPAWDRLGRPFTRSLLDRTRRIAVRLAQSTSDLPVNGDLHFDQVLRGTREPWLAVDPVLLRGDIEYDLARVLWTRIHEMPGAADVRRHFGTLVTVAGLDRERARDWVVFRAVDYWLWGLDHGLTTDPERCRRLVAAFPSGPVRDEG